jgi:hypothetical protein
MNHPYTKMMRLGAIYLCSGCRKKRKNYSSSSMILEAAGSQLQAREKVAFLGIREMGSPFCVIFPGFCICGRVNAVGWAKTQ